MKKFFNLIKSHWQISLYLVVFAILFTAKIINNPFPFFDWDESIYAQVGREMIAKNSLVPLWQGQSWLDKPPLVPLFYGLVMKMTPFLMPEISTRLATLYLTVFALGLIYILYWKALKEQWLTTLVVIITSLTSVFLQRAQVLNVDIFLLIGWLGYVIYYKNFTISLLFLSIAVYSKSLIGFYPLGIFFIFYLYNYITKKIGFNEFSRVLKNLVGQFLVLSIWYGLMYLSFGNNFLYAHFYESHIKRVTSSIESHFGQRTFYIDLLFQEFGKYVWLSFVGFIIIIYQWFKKNLSDKNLLYLLFLLPWFLFLNLTKTKIFWYGHPYIPQFALLMVYPLVLIKKTRFFYLLAIFLIIFTVCKYYFFETNVLDDFYSSNDPHHKIAQEANNYCQQLNVLVEPETREANKTLSSMNLLITTSHWWGNHPSMVYYFHGQVHFLYTEDEFVDKLKKQMPGNCFVINKQDGALKNLAGKKYQYRSDPLLLYTY